MFIVLFSQLCYVFEIFHNKISKKKSPFSTCPPKSYQAFVLITDPNTLLLICFLPRLSHFLFLSKKYKTISNPIYAYISHAQEFFLIQIQHQTKKTKSWDQGTETSIITGFSIMVDEELTLSPRSVCEHPVLLPAVSLIC